MMNFERELSFLLDILKKCHIHTAVLSSEDNVEAMVDSYFTGIVGAKSVLTVGQMLGSVESKTKYKFSDEFKFQYVYIRLPIEDEKNILVIGPYFALPPTAEELFVVIEQTGIPLDAQNSFKEYYLSVPILSESDHLFVVIDAFCERIWETSSFSIVEMDKVYRPFMMSQNPVSQGEGYDDIEANVKMMEMRYSFENELMSAVSLGQQHKGALLVSQLNQQLFERRVADPLRNAKNYCIIMNTLLRKAAERGGVHPIYIDKTSSEFAIKLELLSSGQACTELMAEMFSSYCRLVYKHSMKKYSRVVQKTILAIDSDISAELSLQGLAGRQGVSAGYLATVFKKETGKTILEYIKDKRMEHAMYLLGTTRLQVQTVALHCGIMDVQYFSKAFKMATGKTPKEYRESVNR